MGQTWSVSCSLPAPGVDIFFLPHISAHSLLYQNNGEGGVEGSWVQWHSLWPFSSIAHSQWGKAYGSLPAQFENLSGGLWLGLSVVQLWSNLKGHL